MVSRGSCDTPDLLSHLLFYPHGNGESEAKVWRKDAERFKLFSIVLKWDERNDLTDVVQNLPIRLRQLFHDLEVGRDPALFESFMSIQTCSAETRIPISDQSASCCTMCGRWGGNVLIQHLPSCHCFPIHEIWFHSLSNLLHGSCERILSSDFIVPYPFFSIYGISSSHLW